MRFPYRQYVAELPGTNDFRIVMRPVVTVEITGPVANGRWDALVDTGADETLLPQSVVRLLGVKLDASLTSLAAGVAGEELAYGTARSSCRWPTRAKPTRGGLWRASPICRTSPRMQ